MLLIIAYEAPEDGNYVGHFPWGFLPKVSLEAISKCPLENCNFVQARNDFVVRSTSLPTV